MEAKFMVMWRINGAWVVTTNLTIEGAKQLKLKAMSARQVLGTLFDEDCAPKIYAPVDISPIDE